MTHPPLPAEDLDDILRWVPSFGDLQKGSLFLTGSTGFFGRWLLESLVYADRELDLHLQAMVLSRDPTRFLESAPHLSKARCLTFLAGDIRTLPKVARSFTHVVHGAASTDARNYLASPKEMLDTLTQGTRQILACARHWPVSRFLLLSSGAVYGTQPRDLPRIPEDHPLAPFSEDRSSIYALGKQVSEKLFREAADQQGFGCPIARAFAFVGPHLPLDQHFAAGNFIRDGLQGGPIRIGGDGTPLRSYLYASELAAWVWTLLIKGGNRTYHVGSDQPVSILELANQVAAILECKVTVAQAAIPGASPARYVPEVTRIPQEFGLTQMVDLPVALEKTITWLRSNSGT